LQDFAKGNSIRKNGSQDFAKNNSIRKNGCSECPKDNSNRKNACGERPKDYEKYHLFVTAQTLTGFETLLGLLVIAMRLAAWALP
jgi:hypothetical protein